MPPIDDPDVRWLAEAASRVRAQSAPAVRDWGDSPCAWMLPLAPATKGALSRDIVREWLTANGLRTGKSPDREADLLVEKRRVEIKFSLLWEGGIYKFQQLRDQRYDSVICLGISPYNAHCWVHSKDEVLKNWRGQHGGQQGKDTSEVNFRPGAEPLWFQPNGGRLADALTRIRELAK